MRAAEDALLSRRRPRKAKSSAAVAAPSGKGKARQEHRRSGLIENVAHTIGLDETPDEVAAHKRRKASDAADKLESDLPDGCVDLLKEDEAAEDEVAQRERLRGDPNRRAGQLAKVYRRVGGPKNEAVTEDEVPPDSSAEHAKREAAIVRLTRIFGLTAQGTIVDHDDSVKLSRYVSSTNVAHDGGFKPDREPADSHDDGNPWHR